MNLVGYSTCHWCHVMERESFCDAEVGDILNQHFVSIKVDREERPDVDKMYMTFVQVVFNSGVYYVKCLGMATINRLHIEWLNMRYMYMQQYVVIL